MAEFLVYYCRQENEEKTAEVVLDGTSRQREVWKCERKLTD